MSTRTTIAHGENWHLFREHDDVIWVEIEHGDFEASPSSVCVALSEEVIKAIMESEKI